VDNCVGQANHKTFILFLVYAIVGMTYACVLFTLRLIDIVQLFAAITRTKVRTATLTTPHSSTTRGMHKNSTHTHHRTRCRIR
jgi:hypothetical protein